MGGRPAGWIGSGPGGVIGGWLEGAAGGWEGAARYRRPCGGHPAVGVCSVSHPDRGGVRALIFPSTRSGGCARCGAKQSRPVTLSEEGAPHRPSGALLRRRYVCTGAHTAPAEWRAASGRQRPRRGGPPAAVWAARGLVAETGGGITARPSPAFRYEAKEIRACVSGCNTDAHVLRAHTAAETGKEKEQIACRVSAAATAENKWNKYSKKKKQ